MKSKTVVAALIICMLTIGITGCGETKAEEQNLANETRQHQHDEQVEGEEKEVESVIKKRAAEESATAIESIK